VTYHSDVDERGTRARIIDAEPGFVAWDANRAYRECSARGALLLTDPIDRGYEIRAYMRDPDRHLIEVGQVPTPNVTTSVACDDVTLCDAVSSITSKWTAAAWPKICEGA
jgi:hypothetical protein